MNPDQFASFLRDNPLLAEQLRDLSVPASSTRTRTLGMLNEAKIQLFLLPVLRFILIEFGLPWKRAEGHYTDENRRDFASWADGRDGGASEVVLRNGNRIMQFLELMKSTKLQAGWENLLQELLETQV